MSKGKCYSMVDRGQRRKADSYPTPFSLTKLFLEKESFDDCFSIWEPCAGEGAMARVLMEHFPDKEIIITDKYSNGTVHMSGAYPVPDPPLDFLLATGSSDAVVTNPPYSLFHEIIMKAKRITKKKIAMLLPLSYLQGQKRYDELWQDTKFPLSKIYVFNRQFDLSLSLRDDGMTWLGMQTYAWYVWDKKYRGEPSIRWIECRDYVISPGRKRYE